MITVLRLGHRLGRDSRITTHCGLVSRGLGADRIIFSGDHEQSIVDSINKVTIQWGGKFQAEYDKNWLKAIKDHKKKGFMVVHLTMYGINLPDRIGTIRDQGKERDILLIVGSQKVPGEVYELADHNIAVGNTPHSEISALALFLDHYFMGDELKKRMDDGKLSIVPQEKGKKTLEKE